MSGLAVDRSRLLRHVTPVIMSRGYESPGKHAEQGSVEAGRWPVDTDACGLLDDAGADLKQALADCFELGIGSGTWRGTELRGASVRQYC